MTQSAPSPLALQLYVSAVTPDGNGTQTVEMDAMNGVNAHGSLVLSEVAFGTLIAGVTYDAVLTLASQT